MRGLGLLDTALGPSLLSYCRRLLRHTNDPDRIFTRDKEIVAATGM
ncbi:hypothetical protein [Streptomyces huasconensis]